MDLRLTDYEDPEIYRMVAELLEKLAQRREALDAVEVMRLREDAERAAEFIKEHPEVLPKAPEPEQEADQNDQDPVQNPPVHLITYAQLRAESVKLVKKDRAKMNDILAEFGAGKLGDIAEDDYPAIYERLVSANAG